VILRLGGDPKVAWRACCNFVFYSFPRQFPTPPTSQNWEKENLGLRPLEYPKILYVAFK
jgi:hypothetical protein